MIELHVLIREHSGFFTFSLYYFELFTVKINILQALMQHSNEVLTTFTEVMGSLFIDRELVVTSKIFGWCKVHKTQAK
jgi:succinate dehydrogenase/fumarate reductase cytochrome b subunit